MSKRDERLSVMLRRLCRSLATPRELPDRQLLERFALFRDETAFDLLVRRHGPLVLRACRARLRDAHAADDCFQATFLVLARRAAGLRLRRSLGLWLFEVARREVAQQLIVRLSRERRDDPVDVVEEDGRTARHATPRVAVP